MSTAKTIPPTSNALEVTVTELSSKLKKTVEDTFGHVRVRGEISGFRGPHSSGHCYFSLKDDRARLEAVIWRGQYSKLKYRPEEGMEVVASGKLTTYAGSSKYQIVIDNLEPAGAGALMALLEERRKTLAAEGLFDDSRKQLLPYMPRVIAVVTSPTGAVIRDILHRIGDRFPVHVLVWPVRVQGDSTGPEVANAVHRLNTLPEDGPLPRPDLIIIARGGGSLEDLWGFNDEILVRAAAGSMIPLISAIGHETDWTLLDHAADWRAPTPTAAAEKAVPVKAELEALVADLGARLRGSISRLGERRTNELRSATRGLKTPDNLLAMPRQKFDEADRGITRAFIARVEKASARYQYPSLRLSPDLLNRLIGQKKQLLLERARQLQPVNLENQLRTFSQNFARLRPQLAIRMQGRMVDARENLERNSRLLNSLSYHGVLKRGFAVLRDAHDKPLTGVSNVRPGNNLRVEMHDGKLEVVAGSPADRRASKAKAESGAKGPGNQGTLF